MTRIFHWFFMWKMDHMSGCNIRLYMFTLPPRDSTLQYKIYVHLWDNFPCIITLISCIFNYKANQFTRSIKMNWLCEICTLHNVCGPWYISIVQRAKDERWVRNIKIWKIIFKRNSVLPRKSSYNWIYRQNPSSWKGLLFNITYYSFLEKFDSFKSWYSLLKTQWKIQFI